MQLNPKNIIGSKHEVKLEKNMETGDTNTIRGNINTNILNSRDDSNLPNPDVHTRHYKTKTFL